MAAAGNERGHSIQITYSCLGPARLLLPATLLMFPAPSILKQLKPVEASTDYVTLEVEVKESENFELSFVLIVKTK